MRLWRDASWERGREVRTSLSCSSRVYLRATTNSNYQYE